MYIYWWVRGPLCLWAASTGPELYINFSELYIKWSRTIYKFLRTIYKICLVLPIVHAPLTGNICLRSPPNRSNAGTIAPYLDLHKSCTFCSEKLAEDKCSHEAHGIMPFKTGNCVLPSLLRLHFQMKQPIPVSSPSFFPMIPIQSFKIVASKLAKGSTGSATQFGTLLYCHFKMQSAPQFTHFHNVDWLGFWSKKHTKFHNTEFKMIETNGMCSGR